MTYVKYFYDFLKKYPKLVTDIFTAFAKCG